MAAVAVEYLPAGHPEHADGELAPNSPEYFPAEQPMHVAIESADTAEE